MTDNEYRAREIYCQYVIRVDSGESIDPELFVRQYPEQEALLKRFIMMGEAFDEVWDEADHEDVYDGVYLNLTGKHRRWKWRRSHSVAAVICAILTSIAGGWYFIPAPEPDRMELAQQAAVVGDALGVAEQLSLLINSSTEDSTSLVYRAEAFMKLERWAEAADDYRAAFEMSSEPSYLAFEGFCRSKAGVHDAWVIGCYKDSISNGFDSPEVRSNLALAYCRNGQLKRAKELLQGITNQESRTLALWIEFALAKQLQIDAEEPKGDLEACTIDLTKGRRQLFVSRRIE